MRGIINSELLDRRKELGRQFRSAKPFPHVVIDRFFDDAFGARMAEAFPPFDLGGNLSEDGRRGRKSTVEDLRSLGEPFVSADEVFRSEEFAKLMSELTGIPGLLYDPHYIGGGTHENLP